MYLAALRLQHFRNYQELDLTFSPGLNIVYGENAQGKTNLLEAIYFLATGKSHRTSRDQELIQQGHAELRVEARVVRKTGELTLALQYGLESRKSLRINGIPEKRIASLVGKLAVVFFSPDDLQLIKGAPAGRRRFLDIELSQVSPTYLHHLQVYLRALQQRNALLRQAAERSLTPELLETWDEQIVHAGAEILLRRQAAVRRLGALAADYHRRLSDGREELTFRYVSTVGELPAALSQEALAAVRDQFRARLGRLRREEMARGTTLVGPHRDDLLFHINGQEARLYASQGQQRTAVLALKLAEIQFMREIIGEAPVLLLDDVMSELDPGRRNYLLQAVETGVQTFISCTDAADLMIRRWPAEYRLFRVQSGQVLVKGESPDVSSPGG
ncbi:MAG: DNA replication/repair protein RecF [Bacillota bacterium]